MKKISNIESYQQLFRIMEGIEPDFWSEYDDTMPSILYPEWRIDKLYSRLPKFVYDFPAMFEYDFSFLKAEGEDFLEKKTIAWLSILKSKGLNVVQASNLSSVIKGAFRSSLCGDDYSIASMVELLLMLDNFGLLEAKE